ncbi:MAG: hypothetical protein M1825_005338 [Sarcosagium campestre]|nr:MAG: hypothetical protein M1825_005338 [Sarcosagium campestre]
MSNYSSAAGLGQINTTGFLFGDDESHSKKENSTTSPDVKTYLQMNATDDKFPILVRRNDYPGLLSASSAALDLALSQSPGPESQPSGWPSFARHRPAQHSLPMNTLPTDADLRTDASKHPKAGPTAQLDEGAGSSRNFDRRSLDLSFGPLTEATKTSASPASGSVPGAQVTPPKLGASYSTNDIPTMKNAAGLGGVVPTANSHAQKHFHNHNASLGRIPPNAVNNRLSRDLSNSDVVATGRESQGIGFQPFQSALQASAPPFGPPLHAAASVGHNPAVPNAPTMSPYGLNGYFNGFGMPMMNMNGPQMNNQMYPPQGSYQPYPVYGYGSRGSDSQARVIQQRRMADGEANRFANVQLESLRGEIYPLCKDQHGCRYLQKKLEERTPEHIQIIFLETNQHVVELMTDPFGNYLCQKLLEYANDEQRTVLINNAAPQLVKIALNQHGTRALQKMIEFISTPEQIQTIIYALQDRVVELIQDLNGNHVIQKCLNRLTPEDAQFIFDAVGYSCVTVGTHRHGCCVLQRCIDHASGTQKAQLISQISQNALALVQDPFGNYVVQYILDLGEPSYTEPLVQRFLKQVPALSKQKFSSNVIEKCLRTAEHPMKSLMIEEMLPPVELEKMLRDSYANYVIQTAIDFATPDLQARLVDTIRPMLPTIRSTPFGRRIQGKVQTFDSRSGSSSGQRTPSDVTSPGQISLVGQGHSPFHPRPGSNQGQSALSLNNAFANLNFGQGTRSPAASGIGTPPVVGPSAYGNRLAGAAAPEQYQDGRQNPSGQQQFAGNYGRINAPGNGYYF